MAITVTRGYSKARLRELGRMKADSVEQFMGQIKHSSGDWANRPFELMPWQRDELIRPFYGTLNPDGTRRYRTVWLEIPRKNGKTEIAAGGFILPMLYLDGEMSAQIYGAANDQQQAGLVFAAAAPMVETNPALAARSAIYPRKWRQALNSMVAKRIVYYETGSFYSTISSEAYTKDGFNPHGIVYDEIHAARDRDLWDVLTTAGGARRQPGTIVTTTAGYDRNTIAWELHDYACKVRDGLIDDPTWLVVIYAAPETADWTDEDVWRRANPALGEFRSLAEMRSLCQRAQETPALEMTFRRLFLNQWVNSMERWLPIEKWDACKTEIGADALNGQMCYAGLDLASTTDLTALVLCFPRGDGNFAFLPEFWIPEGAVAKQDIRYREIFAQWGREGRIHITPGDQLDYDWVVQDIIEKRKIYDIQELAFDRWGSQKLIADLVNKVGFVTEPKGPGPHLVQFGQGYASMSAPTKELMSLVLARKLQHDGHPVLRWNMDNLQVSQDAAGNLKPDKAKATQKIDGAVALIMALDRATRHQGDGKSIYEERGPLIF